MMVDEAYHLVSFGLVVLIWLVQIVIYPAFADIAPERFTGWHSGYTRAVTWIVAPLMLAQLILLSWLLFSRPTPWMWLAAGLVLVAWIATFALAVPVHQKLQQHGQDAELIGRLVATNWVRTVAWSLAFLFSLFELRS